MVEAGCPQLLTWNGVKVQELAQQAESATWAEHLVLHEVLGWDNAEWDDAEWA